MPPFDLSSRRRPRGVCLKLIATLWLAGTTLCTAQTPAPLPTPDLEVVSGASVSAVLALPDGSSVIGGDFSLLQGASRNHLGRIGNDHLLDAWAPDPDGPVQALAIDDSGRIYVGGNFTSIAGANRQRLARFLPDGSLDPDWTPVSSATVSALRLDSTGRVYAIGGFSVIEGQPQRSLARIGTDGEIDASWDAGPLNASIFTIAVDSDDSLLVAGLFSSIGGVSRSGIARLLALDGSVDPQWAPQPSNSVHTLLTLDGFIYIGGLFDTLSGQSIAGLARVSGPTAEVDTSWDPEVTQGGVFALAADPDGRLLIEGSFLNVGGLARSFLARVSSGASAMVDAAFAPVATGSAQSLDVHADGRVLVGGTLAAVEGESRTGVVVLNDAGELHPKAVDAERAGEVNVLAGDELGNVYLAGGFRRIGSTLRTGLARIDAEGQLDADWSPAPNAEVRSMVADSGGALFVAGNFSAIDGVPRIGLARLLPDGTPDPAWIANANSPITQIALDPAEGWLYATGSFTLLGGVSVSRLGRIAVATGAADAGWAPTPDASVSRILPDRDGGLYVAGGFTSFASGSRLRLARIAADASLTGFDAAPDGSIVDMALRDNGDLYVAGNFSNIGGAARPGLARLDGDSGVADPQWVPGSAPFVNRLASDEGDLLYVGGQFSSLGGTPRRRLARYLGSEAGVPDPAWNPGLGLTSVDGTQLRALLPMADAGLLVAGRLARVAGQPRTALAALPSTQTLRYLAGAGGSLEGEAVQPVPHGRDAQPVRAVPDVGFGFAGWSDGNANALRQDLAVIAPMTLQANFANAAPQLLDLLPQSNTLFERETLTLSARLLDDNDQPNQLMLRVDCAGNTAEAIELEDDLLRVDCRLSQLGSAMIGIEVEDRAGAASAGNVLVTVLDSRPALDLHIPTSVDEDQPAPLQITTSLPSSAEAIARIEVDCDFTDSFTADLVNGPDAAFACPGYPTPGTRRIAARAFDDEDEVSPVAEAALQVLAVNDPPQFVATARVELLEDAAALSLPGWASAMLPGPAEATDEFGQSLQFELVGPHDPSAFAIAPTLDGDGRLHLAPAKDATGTFPVAFRLCDDGTPVACSAPQSGDVVLLPVNDPPQLSLGDLPLFPRASGGPRSFPGFARFDAGPDDEDLSQQVLGYLIGSVLDPDGVLQLDSLSIDPDGTLQLSLSGAAGVAAVAVRVQDDGGNASGGVDLSSEQLFTVNVVEGSDIQLGIDNGVQRLVVGDRSRYAIVVANAGPDPVEGAILTGLLPEALNDAEWRCRSDLSTAACPQPDAGLGNLVSRIDLAVGQLLRFDLEAEVADSGQASVDMHVRIDLPPGLAPIAPDNDLASDIDALLPRTLHLDGFEALPGAGLSDPHALRALRAP